MTRRRDILVTAGLTSLALVAFAANSLLCRAALAGHHADAATFTTVRLLSGAAVLSVLVRGLRWPLRPRAARVAAASLFAYAILFSAAYTRIPAAVGALALFGAVQLTMIGAGLAAGHRPTRGEAAGVIVACAGLLALTRPGLARPDPWGTLCMALAGVAWGLYSLGGSRRGDPTGANAESFVGAAALAAALQLLLLPFAAPRADGRGVLLATVSGGVTSALGYAVWYAALRGLTPLQAAVLQLLVPPLAALGAVLVLGEPLSGRLVGSAAAVLGGIALVLAARRR